MKLPLSVLVVVHTAQRDVLLLERLEHQAARERQHALALHRAARGREHEA